MTSVRPVWQAPSNIWEYFMVVCFLPQMLRLPLISDYLRVAAGVGARVEQDTSEHYKDIPSSSPDQGKQLIFTIGVLCASYNT